MKKFKMILSALLSAVLCISTVAFVAYAQEEENFTEIWSIEDLYCINLDLAGNYKLMCDIDMGEATAKGGDWDYMGNGWDPIGDIDGNYDPSKFTGLFDGNNHSIDNMNIRGGKTIGLFGDNAGTIKNLTMKNVNISTTSSSDIYVGAISAKNSGTISDCVVNGLLSCKNTYVSSSRPSSHVGGICGYNNKEIIACANNSTVTELETYSSYVYGYAGGIAGLVDTGGTVTDSYNTGSISATDNASGISCYGTITNCYNVGNLSGSNKYAISKDGTRKNCYFLNSVSSGTYTGCKSLTPAQMKMQFMYNGFDFDNVWEMNSILQRPTLRNAPEPIEFEGVEVATLPTKTQYNQNEDVDVTGGTLSVKLAGEETPRTLNMTNDMVKSYDTSKAGTATVTCDAYGNEFTFDIEVISTEPTTVEPTTSAPTTAEPTTVAPTSPILTRKNGDVNCDGNVNILDATLIQRYAAGIIPSLEVYVQ